MRHDRSRSDAGGPCARRRFGGLLSLLVLCAACAPPARPPLNYKEQEEEVEATPLPPTTASAQLEAEVDRALQEPPFTIPTPPWETWDSYYLSGQRVGYSHLKAEPVQVARETLVRYELEEFLQLRRGQDSIEQRLRQTSQETLDGRLRSFESHLQIGPSEVVTRGRVRGQNLVLSVTRDGQTSEQRVAWQEHYRGPVALQQALRGNAWTEGQVRRFEALLPIQHQVAAIELRAIGPAAIPLEDGSSARALEIESRVSVGDQLLTESVIWVDESGEALKSLLPAINLASYRTDRASALAEVDSDLDVLETTSIPLARGLDRPTQTRIVRFGVSAKGGEAADLAQRLQAQPGQRIREGEDGRHDVVVRSGPDPTFTGFAPGEGDRQPGPLIQSNDTMIRRLAAIPAADLAPRPLALALASVTATHVTAKDFSRGFASAAEVARDGTGDCTEHSVLLAAMLRARGIPARVAAGLVYVDSPSGPALAYHMWTLAWVDDAWLPLDATIEGGVASASRITLVTSDLADGNEYACLMPVIGVLGRLEVEVIEARYGEAPSQ